MHIARLTQMLDGFDRAGQLHRMPRTFTQMLRADAEGHGCAGLCEAAADWDRHRLRLAEIDGQTPGIDGQDLALDEVHLRRTDEAGDKLILRMVIELERRADL